MSDLSNAIGDMLNQADSNKEVDNFDSKQALVHIMFSGNVEHSYEMTTHEFFELLRGIDSRPLSDDYFKFENGRIRYSNIVSASLDAIF